MAETKSITEMIADISPYYANRVKQKEKGKIDSVPETEHILTYESYAESLEPIYFFVLDLMNDFGLFPEKLIDNFSPSPGSTQFAEMTGKATSMQQSASKVLGDVNTVLRGVLNIIYELKEFKMRLQTYDDYASSDENTRAAALLALKQLWMDKVDINKGNSSIKGMATQGGFPTLIDAFLAARTIEDALKFDLNDRVKRILMPRIQEFNTWVVQSEQQLRKTYSLEKTYLKSQANSLKLYSRWAKPYLLAAQKLEQKVSKNAALVNVFNRTILELTLLGKNPVKLRDSSLAGELPAEFQNERFTRQFNRKYNTCVLIDFVFRAVPQQGAHIGRVDVTFRGYSLNDNEIDKLKQELDKSDLGDVLKLINGATDDSINNLQAEINFFLDEDEGKPVPGAKKKAEGSSSGEDVNPFLALIGYYDTPAEAPKKEGKKPAEKEIIVKPDTWLEAEHLRPLAAKKAKEIGFNLFDVYKKAHGMASYT